MTKRLGVLIPRPGGDGGFVDAALGAVSDATEALPDVRVEVVEASPEAVDPAWLHAGWDVLLAHGGQYAAALEAWARGLSSAERASRPRAIVMSDLVDPAPAVPGLTMIDWAWAEAARDAGAALAATRSDGPIGLVAGPAVRTQRRIASEFCAGVLSVRDAEVITIHLASFGDVEGARRASGLLERAGCRAFLHTADAAGAAGSRGLVASGARGIGFLDPTPGDIGWIRSDIRGQLASLLSQAIAGEELPALVTAGLASGRLGLVLD